jgi:hypothetical protein
MRECRLGAREFDALQIQRPELAHLLAVLIAVERDQLGVSLRGLTQQRFVISALEAGGQGSSAMDSFSSCCTRTAMPAARACSRVAWYEVQSSKALGSAIHCARRSPKSASGMRARSAAPKASCVSSR